MAQYVALRALNRSAKVRIKNSAGTRVSLSTTVDTVVDLDDPDVRRQLGHHSAIGQYIVTAANDFDGAVALPTNT